MLTLGLPLTTRCPGTLHLGSRSLAPSHLSLGQHALASFFLGPGSWGPDTDRLAWFPTQTRPQLPLSTHLPFGETKSHLVSVSLQLCPVSPRTKSRTHPAGSQGGEGGHCTSPGRVSRKGRWSWIGPTGKCRSVRPPAPPIIEVVAASQGCRVSSRLRAPGDRPGALARLNPAQSPPPWRSTSRGRTCSVPSTGGRICLLSTNGVCGSCPILVASGLKIIFVAQPVMNQKVAV